MLPRFLRSTSLILLGFAALGLLPSGTIAPAHAQDFERPAVLGVVENSAGERLRGVEVQLINLGSGEIVAAETDLAGEFRFVDLTPGRYSLGFFLEGYAAQRLPAQELLPGPPLSVSVRLDPLGPPLTRPRSGIETIAIEFGMVREQIAATPVLLGTDGRTVVDKLTLLAPGLSPVDALEVDPYSGRAAAVSANGSRRSAINYELDGSDNNAQNRIAGSQAATFAPAPEAIEIFRAITHTYSAREGRNSGAVISPALRNGGDQLHGQLRLISRPHSGVIESFDGAQDSLGGWAGGGQVGGPLWSKKKLYFFLDAEGWKTTRRHTPTSPVLSDAVRAGDLSGFGQPLADPDAPGAFFPNAEIPADRLDPLMQDYLDAFVPRANVGEDLYRLREDFDSSGQMALGRLDWKPGAWTFGMSHVLHRINADSPVDELAAAPGLTEQRRQIANNAQARATWSPTPSFTQESRLSGQRLSIAQWRGVPAYQGVSADEFGFDFAGFGSEVGTIPDVTLYDDEGFVQLRVAPFLDSESSAQTTWQLSHDVSWRKGRVTARGGALWREGSFPFQKNENFGGSFSFPEPPDPIRAISNGLRDLLLAKPGQYRLQTPRDLNLRWRERGLYGQAELRVLRNLQLTLGLRLESQPPAVDTQDRIGAFRIDGISEKFGDDTLRGMIFPGDPDPLFDGAPLSRSTILTNGLNWAPRLGISYSPSSGKRMSRWLLGEPGRSVIRASYGQFYDFGAFAGSSSNGLFQSTTPPFNVDNRFDFTLPSTRPDAFRRPFASTGGDPSGIFQPAVLFPIQVFAPDFQNARARQWNVGFQRILPSGVFLSAVYVGTESERLQRQSEINTFVRNPLRGFAFVRSMRLFTRFNDVRQFESSGTGRYNALQLRANRYLKRGLAFDVGYTWSRSDDDGSSIFGEELSTETRTASSFDRRHNLVASWVWETRLPRSWPRRLGVFDQWNVSGMWRWRSGLPLDITQNEDPTFTFEETGRPDVLGVYQRLDPGQVRKFTMTDGREVTGRFAFDPTIFAPVVPTNFDETRPGTLGRNAVRMQGYQQWDLRLARPFEVTEGVSAEIGLDLMNAFGHKNWDRPFTNIDHPFFGVARTEGVGRTYQATLRMMF